VPSRLIDGLVERHNDLRDVQIYQIHTENHAPYVDYPESFFTNCMFVGANTRRAVNDGRAAYIPVFLGQIPRFLASKISLDVALIHVSPPDKHGFCSLGVSVDCTEAAVQLATTVIAQVNPKMPRVLGDGLIQ
jgi:4-hydroxybutyrate CoA-transferase